MSKIEAPVSLSDKTKQDDLTADFVQEGIKKSKTDRWIKLGAFGLVVAVCAFAMYLTLCSADLSKEAFDLVKILVGAAAGYALSRADDSA
mmetsp:Transcript_119882/g.168769  ORF Transcript_119882/g.168769 Transcript_119882/m.168769 type:complete len:90 (+) Transcript_119882:279-548(+)